MKLGLTEKIWFGKHKDERLVDIIENYPKYIHKLYDEYNVELSEDAYEYYKSRTRQSSKRSPIDGYSRHNIGGSMSSLGFDFVSYSKGGFMNLWLETNEVKGRQPAKHKWVMEQMRDGNVIAIPNAGVKTYVMDIEKLSSV